MLLEKKGERRQFYYFQCLHDLSLKKITWAEGSISISVNQIYPIALISYLLFSKWMKNGRSLLGNAGENGPVYLEPRFLRVVQVQPQHERHNAEEPSRSNTSLDQVSNLLLPTCITRKRTWGSSLKKFGAPSIILASHDSQSNDKLAEVAFRCES